MNPLTPEELEQGYDLYDLGRLNKCARTITTTRSHARNAVAVVLSRTCGTMTVSRCWWAAIVAHGQVVAGGY